MNTKMQYIVILGAGESGVGAALLAKAKGYAVFVSDAGKIKDKYKVELTNNQIDWEEGGHTMTHVLSADEIIKSPGIPNSSALIQEVLKTGLRPISDIEFAARYTAAKLIAITGSNGKTTTTHLVHHVLNSGGLAVEMAGNVGVSFGRNVIEDKADYYVIELSFFPMEDMDDFKADIAILLNITPDHLDRYNDSILEYGQAKMRVMQNQTADDVFIYNADDIQIKKQLETHKINTKS